MDFSVRSQHSLDPPKSCVLVFGMRPLILSGSHGATSKYYIGGSSLRFSRLTFEGFEGFGR